MKVKDISLLINRHEGESALIVGSAPTLGLVETHTVQVGLFVGDSMLRTGIRPPIRYYVRANGVYPNLTKKSHVSDLRKLDATWVIAQTVVESPTPVRQLLERMPPSDKESFVFDQRHFGGSSCSVVADCCHVLDMEPGINWTIQEILASYSESNSLYSSGSTVSLHALALSVIMGCKEIHVAGVEIPRKASDYVYAPIDRGVISEIFSRMRSMFSRRNIRRVMYWVLNRSASNPKAPSPDDTPSIFAPDFDQILSDFETIVKLAKAKKTKVFVCSPTSNLLNVDGVLKCELISQ